MADNARGIHVSPGIYTREIDMNYAVRSLGITTLGLVGETLKGPAFQPMDIANWREFQDVFGGTSTEKYKGSQYPKYELPYIAKSYLSESEQLKVVRVLGLSGYNAGPAWLVTANGQAVALLRSRGSYKPFETGSTTACTCEPSKYDTLKFYVGESLPEETPQECKKIGYNLDALMIEPYIPINSSGDECQGYELGGGNGNMSISQYNHGRFKIVGWKNSHKASDLETVRTARDAYKENPTDETKKAYEDAKAGVDGYFEYPVSLNPSDKEYILNVLGTKPYDGDAYVFVETLYDVALGQGIIDGALTEIDGELTGYQAYYTADYCHHEPISDLMSIPTASLRRKNVGQRFLADASVTGDSAYTCVAFDYNTGKPVMVGVMSGNTMVESEGAEGALNPLTGMTEEEQKKADTIPAIFKVTAGQIYTVRQYTTVDGKRHYYYGFYTEDSINDLIDEYVEIEKTLDPTNLYGNLVRQNVATTAGTRMEKAYQFDKINANAEWGTLVLNMADGLYYRMYQTKNESEETIDDVWFVELDLNDYKSAYRYASTPWIVSNLKGDYDHVEINKLFRFHTITDGNNANYEIKVSIENIKPDAGTFDVVVRRIDDADEQIIPLERFGACSMIPGSANYIAFKIGSFDGVYESKSKYITVEVNDSTAARMSVPAGFLGYPRPMYDGLQIVDPDKTEGETAMPTFPTLAYNKYYDADIKKRFDRR